MAPPRRLESATRRLRARIGDEWVLDVDQWWLLYEPDQYPVYVVGADDLAVQVDGPGRPLAGATVGDGTGAVLTASPDRTVRCWLEAPRDIPELAGKVAVPFEAVDEWFEEDELQISGIRDPYRRVDVLPSGRLVEITVGGVAVASSRSAVLAVENAMPPVWYLPLTSFDDAVLRRSGTNTTCQYKGVASYFDVVTAEAGHDAARHVDLAWEYRWPLPGVARLAGHVAVSPWHPDVVTLIDGQPAGVELPNDAWRSPSARGR